MFLSWIETELSFYSNCSNDNFLSLYIICKHFHEAYLFFYYWCNYVISIYGGTIVYRWTESKLWSGRSGNRIILGKGTRRKVQGIKTGGKGLSQESRRAGDWKMRGQGIELLRCWGVRGRVAKWKRDEWPRDDGLMAENAKKLEKAYESGRYYVLVPDSIAIPWI